MALIDSRISDRYAVYNGDCCEVLAALPAESIDYSVYSPPFGGLYHYSSDDRDLSNAASYAEFLEHYSFVVAEIARLTKPGRLTSVHCMDFVKGCDLGDLPGDIVRIHREHGFVYHDRKTIWKEPLKVAMRTRALGLRHSQLVKDASLCRSALADYVLTFAKDHAVDDAGEPQVSDLLTFRKAGTNRVPIEHIGGLTSYAGAESIPEELLRYVDWKDPRTNKLSHWIWRRYASAIWDDVRVNRVLPYRGARESEEEKHVHPLQLDVIERCVSLWSNPGERVLTPFAGVGSEVVVPVDLDRFAVGVELKPSYYRQMLANLDSPGAASNVQDSLFGEDVDPQDLGDDPPEWRLRQQSLIDVQEARRAA